MPPHPGRRMVPYFLSAARLLALLLAGLGEPLLLAAGRGVLYPVWAESFVRMPGTARRSRRPPPPSARWSPGSDRGVHPVLGHPDPPADTVTYVTIWGDVNGNNNGGRPSVVDASDGRVRGQRVLPLRRNRSHDVDQRVVGELDALNAGRLLPSEGCDAPTALGDTARRVLSRCPSVIGEYLRLTRRSPSGIITSSSAARPEFDHDWVHYIPCGGTQRQPLHVDMQRRTQTTPRSTSSSSGSPTTWHPAKAAALSSPAAI